jgi:hypothetical protein
MPGFGEHRGNPCRSKAVDRRLGSTPEYQRHPDRRAKAGDVVTASVATGDGVLDLGTQRVVIRDGA